MTDAKRAPRPGPVLAPLTPQDLEDAAELHLRAFPGFFLSSLGGGVLKEFYRGHILSPRAVAFTARDPNGRLVGVVTGTMTPKSVYREMLARNPFRLTLALALVAARRPSLIFRLTPGVRYGSSVPWEPNDAALLNSICVDPDIQGKGVGLALMNAWITEAQSRGTAPSAYLTTDAVGNDAVRRWYESNGWTLKVTFTRADGRKMAAYQRFLAASSSA